MTAAQLDLFGGLDADTARKVDALTCIRDAIPQAMEMVIHLAYWWPHDRRNIGAGGGWADSIRRDGLHFERADDWWGRAYARGEPFGWNRTPAHLLTWPELADLTGDDPRRPGLITWSQSLTAIDAWKDRMRPYELWPESASCNPSYIKGDHERPGWGQRIAAWRGLYALLDDAIARLDPAGAAV